VSDPDDEFDGDEMWLWLCLYTDVYVGAPPSDGSCVIWLVAPDVAWLVLTVVKEPGDRAEGIMRDPLSALRTQPRSPVPVRCVGGEGVSAERREKRRDVVVGRGAVRNVTAVAVVETFVRSIREGELVAPRSGSTGESGGWGVEVDFDRRAASFAAISRMESERLWAG
jgi:hypothetical protein